MVVVRVVRLREIVAQLLANSPPEILIGHIHSISVAAKAVLVKRRVAFSIACVAVLVIVLGFMAFYRASTDNLGARPQPAHDYATAMARAKQQQRVDDVEAAPQGRSILLVHGQCTPRAVVLLHGYTNSPAQMDSLANLLYREGDNVYVPRLPHHAERAGRA